MPQKRQSGPQPESRGPLRPDSESGIVLLFVLFLAALMLIALAVAAPRIATSIQRDKEIELVHRGEQYRRAIKLYYRKFGAYPTSINQLLNTDNIRFLRKRYTDPITGKDDWRIIHLGQAKVPPMGFFGQPLAGLPGQTNVGTPVSAVAANPLANTTPGTLPSNPFPSDNGSDATDPGQSSDSSEGSSIADSSQSSASGTATSPTSTSTSGSAGTSASPFGSNSSSPFGSNSGSGSTFGGGPIVGVGIPSPKASLIAYKKQKQYNKWEFVYNPIEDQMQAAAAALNGGNVQSMSGANSSTGSSGSNSPFSNSGSPFGNSSGGGSFGNNGSFSNNGSNDTGFGSSPSPISSSPQQPQ